MSQIEQSSNRGKHLVTFKHHGKPGSQICVAGEFNGWNTTSHPLSDKTGKGEFERRIFLPTGRFAYKFVADGEWKIDPNCAHWQPNEFGTLNSLAVSG